MNGNVQQCFFILLCLIKHNPSIGFQRFTFAKRTYNNVFDRSSGYNNDVGNGRSSIMARMADENARKDEEDEARQWELFTKHHARGEWRGKWTFYNYLGDVVDSTVGSVILQPLQDGESVIHNQAIFMEQDSTSDGKIIPIGEYKLGDLKKHRCGSLGMICGPSLLRSGAMSTELILCHEDERVRVIFQHAPVWEQGVEPGSCPPQGLKLFRTMISHESLVTSSSSTPSTPTPIPPYTWFAKWSGTSWTWGPTTSDRGWTISELDETDSWHGRPTGDNPNVWSLRLLGNRVLIQAPRIVYPNEVDLCRLAWLVEEKEGAWKLLRMEGGVWALEPMLESMEGGDDALVGFHPPRLGSLRCDVLQKIGELENVSILDKEPDDIPVSTKTAASQQVSEQKTPGRVSPSVPKSDDSEDKNEPDDFDDLRNSIRL